MLYYRAFSAPTNLSFVLFLCRRLSSFFSPSLSLCFALLRIQIRYVIWEGPFLLSYFKYTHPHLLSPHLLSSLLWSPPSNSILLPLFSLSLLSSPQTQKLKFTSWATHRRPPLPLHQSRASRKETWGPQQEAAGYPAVRPSPAWTHSSRHSSQKRPS